MVVKVKGGYRIRSEKTGKLYPKIYTSKKAAKEIIANHQMFKHINQK